MHDVRGRQPRLTAHRSGHGIACGDDGFELADGVGEQPAKRPQPHPRFAEVGLRDGFVLLRDALVGEHPFGQPLGVDVGDVLGAPRAGIAANSANAGTIGQRYVSASCRAAPGAVPL